MEAKTEGQGDAKRMLCTITLEVATIIKEVLQAGFHVDTKMRGEVILNTET
jgi:hypothetical protein